MATLPPEELIILVDPERCMGCRSCEIACAVEHSESKSIYGAPFERPLPIPRVRILVVPPYNVPMRCQHCKEPPCMAVCPTKAIDKTPEGFVVLNPERCIGCLMCALACPFGHPKYSAELRVVVKCDFCVDRLRRGLEPACVEACPTGALRFGTVEELMREVAEEKARRMISGLEAAPGRILVLPGAERVEEAAPPPVKVSDVHKMYSRVRWG